MTSRYGLQIRTAAPADAPGIAELILAAGREVDVTALTKRLETLQHASGTALLALELGPPSGIIVLTWYPVLSDDRPIARITSLLVGPDERRRGVGRLLLKAAAQAARSAHCATLYLPAWDHEPTVSAFAIASGFDLRGKDFVRGLRKGADQSRS